MSETNRMRLLWAGFMAILAAGVGFGIRGGILDNWAAEFGFTGAQTGAILGAGFSGFCFGIIIGGFIADRIGYGKLVMAAFVMHVVSAVIALAASPEMGQTLAYQCLFWGSFIFAVANGTLEAVANPLVATLFPEKRTHYLNILHASWPAGLVLGAACGWYLDDKMEIHWKMQLALFLIPSVIYGLMFFGQKFPKSEASQKGLGLGEMFRDVGVFGGLIVCYLLALFFKNTLGFDAGSSYVIGVVLLIVAGMLTRQQTEVSMQSLGLLAVCALFGAYMQIAFDLPTLASVIIGGALLAGLGMTMRWAVGAFLLFILFIAHALVGAVELGTDGWIQNITGNILTSEQGKILFVFTSAVMFALRFCADFIERNLGLSPVGILFVCAVLACLGLNLASGISTFGGAVVALGIYAVGKTFFWPTMLAVASDRYPRTGAVAISMMGGIGMLSAGLIGGPGLGYAKDRYFADEMKDGNEAIYEEYKAETPSQFLIFAETHGPDGKMLGSVQGTLKSAQKLLPPGGASEAFAALDAKIKGAKGEMDSASSRMETELKATAKLQTELDEIEGGEWTPKYREASKRLDEAVAKMKPLAEEFEKMQAKHTGLTNEFAGLEKVRDKLKEVGVFTAEGTHDLTGALAALTPEERIVHAASIEADRRTLKADAWIPFIMAVIYLCIMLYFRSIGGYKPVNIEGEELDIAESSDDDSSDIANDDGGEDKS